MHILLIHQAFADLDEPGGTRHAELARYLVERGHQVTVIASPVSYLTGTASQDHQRITPPPVGLTIERAYTYAALHRSFVHRVFSFISFMASSFFAGLNVKNVDIVWGTSPPIFQGVTAWALARLKGVPFLFEVRDLWPEFAIAVGVLRNPLLIRMSCWLERFLYRHASLVMPNSPGFVEHIRRLGGTKIQVIPNGSDPRMFDPASHGSTFRQQHGVEGKFVVMYAGAHGMSNDLGVVLQAANLLRQRSDISFILVGDGKDKPALMVQAAALGLNNVQFIPPVSKLGMPEALAAADACIAILKSIPAYKTVYPNKVFDYMAAARPVILCIDGVIRDVVEEVSAGLPIHPGSPSERAAAIAAAVCQLADQPDTGRQMGLRGRKYVETHFDRAILAGELENLLKNLVHFMNTQKS